jgi:hypothetical protein
MVKSQLIPIDGYSPQISPPPSRFRPAGPPHSPQETAAVLRAATLKQLRGD